jgi:hypothetical protein
MSKSVAKSGEHQRNLFAEGIPFFEYRFGISNKVFIASPSLCSGSNSELAVLALGGADD